MAARKPRISNTRDLGFGAGKGDAPRTVFNTNWRARFDIIKWPEQSDDGFVRDGHKLVKVYGRPVKQPLNFIPLVPLNETHHTS